MNQTAPSPATDYEHIDSFNYANWPANTTLTFTNVRWSNDYRDIVRMENQAAMDTWIDSKPKMTITNAAPHKFQNPRIRINKPLNAAMKYNYLRVSNPVTPAPGDVKRNYYYFVLDPVAVAGSVTELTLQLDVWQTFGYEVEFGLCYAERGHISIANQHAFDNYGRDYLALPEGLDVGAEYRIVKTASQQIMSISDYSVLVVSSVNLAQDPGTAAHPKLYTATGSVVDGLISGASFYIFPTPSDFLKFQKKFAQTPWVTQGILSVTMIPHIDRYHASATLNNVAPVTWPGQDVTYGPDDDIPDVVQPNYTMYNYPQGASQPKDTAIAPDWRDTFLNFLPTAFRGLKKFLTYPYSVIEVTTWSGQPLIVRPESWQDDDATIRELAVMAPPGQRIAFIPYRYNADGVAGGATDDGGEFLDFSTTIDNFPNVPIVNDMAINFLAANKNGLAFQFRQADWSQQRALMGAQATQDVAGAEIRNTARQSAAGISALGAQAQLNIETQNNLGLIGGALGTVGVRAEGGVEYGAKQGGGIKSSYGGGVGASLNPMALAGYDASAGIQANATSQAAMIQGQAMGARAQSSITAAGEVRDTNVSLARRAAQGDYGTTIAGIKARIQDARLTQPSTSGQFGGDAMNLAHSKTEIALRWKIVDPGTVKRIGMFWLRYGYVIDQYVNIPANFMCMSKFTYWKLTETYIKSANIPEMFKQAIRGIFEKGVTVWASPDYIGVTDLSDNTPNSGVSY